MTRRSTAVLDWETRIVKAQTLIPFAPLFHAQAVEGLQTFDSLIMVDAVNQPTFGEICRSWIREFVGQIFGAYDPETGIRHITEFFLLISKKNGKSTTAAAIMLTALILNWRHDAEFIILSPTIEVAQNSFKPAASMVRADPELDALLMVQDHTRTITHRVTGATLKVVAADINTVSGKKTVGLLVDELWLLGKNPRAYSMLMEAAGGLASRPEGFIIYLTTQSDEPPAGVFKSKLEYARGVRDGTIDDPQFLPVIYEFPRDMIKRREHLDFAKNAYITNPNLSDPKKPEKGGSVSVDFLNRGWRMAQEEGEEKVRIFLAKHLNVELGLNLVADRWAGADYWEAAAQVELVDIDFLIEHSEVITFGVDGGGLDDLLGGAAVGRAKEDSDITIPEHIDELTGDTIPAETYRGRKWYVWLHAWAHPSVLLRRKDIVTKLRDCEKEGSLTVVRHAGQDADMLAAAIYKVEKAELLNGVGFDPACVGGLVDAVLNVGVEPEKIFKVNQGYKLAGSIKTTERKLWANVIVHDGNLLGNWSAGNAKVVVRGNGAYVTKQVSGTAKIDVLIALFNAVALMELNPEAMLGNYNFDNMIIAG